MFSVGQVVKFVLSDDEDFFRSSEPHYKMKSASLSINNEYTIVGINNGWLAFNVQGATSCFYNPSHFEGIGTENCTCFDWPKNDEGD